MSSVFAIASLTAPLNTPSGSVSATAQLQREQILSQLQVNLQTNKQIPRSKLLIWAWCARKSMVE